MKRVISLCLAVTLGGTAFVGTGYAATGQTPPHHAAAMHRHARGNLLARIDANKDGVITKAEAEAAADARFDKFDSNHDGKIDQTEIAAAKTQMRARMRAMRANRQAPRSTPAPAAPADHAAGQ